MIFLYAKATRGSEKGIEAEPTVWEQVWFVETVSDILMSSPGRKGGRRGSGSSHRNCTGFLSWNWCMQYFIYDIHVFFWSRIFLNCNQRHALYLNLLDEYFQIMRFLFKHCILWKQGVPKVYNRKFTNTNNNGTMLPLGVCLAFLCRQGMWLSTMLKVLPRRRASFDTRNKNPLRWFLKKLTWKAWKMHWPGKLLVEKVWAQ